MGLTTENIVSSLTAKEIRKILNDRNGERYYSFVGRCYRDAKWCDSDVCLEELTNHYLIAEAKRLQYQAYKYSCVLQFVILMFFAIYCVASLDGNFSIGHLLGGISLVIYAFNLAVQAEKDAGRMHNENC